METLGGFLVARPASLSRTIVNIDGFNLYYRALRGKVGVRWLDLVALARAAMPAPCVIVAVNYYTANVSGRIDRAAPARQNLYIRALETCPDLAIHMSNFLTKKVWAGLAQPPEFKPDLASPLSSPIDVAKVWKTEEKGSDVNLGVHLVRDAFLSRFDEAAILTNDSDLCEAVRIVTLEAGLRVTHLNPEMRPSGSLQKVCNGGSRHIQHLISGCQLPDPLIRIGKPMLHKPPSW